MSNSNIIMLVILAVGAWMLFSDQIKALLTKATTKVQTIVEKQATLADADIKIDASDVFSKIKALIMLAEQSEKLGVTKAGTELRQAAATALLKPND